MLQLLIYQAPRYVMVFNSVYHICKWVVNSKVPSRIKRLYLVSKNYYIKVQNNIAFC